MFSENGSLLASVVREFFFKNNEMLKNIRRKLL